MSNVNQNDSQDLQTADQLQQNVTIDPHRLGLPRSEWIKYLIAAIVAVLTFVGGLLFPKSPNLIFTVAEPAQFQGAKNQTGIITVIVTSNGSVQAEQVTCSIDLGKAKLEETVSNDLNITMKSTANRHQFELPSLAIGATWRLSLLVSNVLDLPSPIGVAVKSKEIVGVSSTQPNRGSNESRFLYFGIGFFSCIIIFGFVIVLIERIEAKIRLVEYKSVAKNYETLVNIESRQLKKEISALHLEISTLQQRVEEQKDRTNELRTNMEHS